MTQTRRPILLELDERTWTEKLERVEPWLATTRMLQSTFRRLLESAVGSVSEPHLHDELGPVLAAARRHEALVDDLWRGFGHEPAEREPFGAAVSRTRRLVGQVEGPGGGARGGEWLMMRELMITNLDALGAFAVTEQLALALGRPAVVDIAVPVIEEKAEHGLLLREIMLEMATNAILHHRDA
jgi:hypothetical protein